MINKLVIMEHINPWESYIGKIFTVYPNSVIYLKGGAVIGFLLLRDHQDNIGAIYNLFNDFDFTLENLECCNDYFYNEFGKEYNIFSNNKKYKKGKRTLLHVMRSENGDNLFELYVCEKDINLEIPMTSMKLHITINNYFQIFSLIRKIYQKNLLEDDLNLLKVFEFYIPKSDQNGMFADNVLSYEISTTIKNIIDKISPNINSVNLLYYLIKNPTDLSRLQWKNIPKSDYIRSLGYQYDWLINNDLYLKLVNDLIFELSQVVNEIYQSHKLSINIFINEINNSDDWEDKIYLEQQLRDHYIELFGELNKIFEGINIIRWKNHINLYIKLTSTSALDCIINIFSFYPEIMIVKSKFLLENPIWLLVIELIRLGK